MNHSRFATAIDERCRTRRFSNQLIASGEILTIVIDLLVSGEVPTRSKLEEIAGWAYDKYVAPIDIPGVPNIIEPRLDTHLKSYFVDAVLAVYDRLTQ